MKFIKFTCNIGCCDCRGEEYNIYPDSIDNDKLKVLSDKFAQDYAFIHDDLIVNEISEDDYDTAIEYEDAIEAKLNAYYESVENRYEELSPKEWLDMTYWSNKEIIDRIFEILQEEYNS